MGECCKKRLRDLKDHHSFQRWRESIKLMKVSSDGVNMVLIQLMGNLPRFVSARNDDFFCEKMVYLGKFAFTFIGLEVHNLALDQCVA